MSYKLKLYISALYTNCITSILYNQSQKRGKGKELTGEERAFIVGTAKGGVSITKIAAETKRPKGTIATILTRFRSRGNFQTAKRSGRPSITTPRDERSLTRLVREDCRAPAKDLAERWGAMIKKTVSERTIRRRLNSLGYNGRQARKKLYISAKTGKREWNGQGR